MSIPRWFGARSLQRILIAGAYLASTSASRAFEETKHSVVTCDGLDTVFRGFTLVEQRACKEPEYVPHGVTPIAGPKAFRFGICYFYLLRADSPTSAHRLFEQRLREEGAAITHSPTISHDMVELISGGPLFQINFRKAGIEGIINGVQDPVIAGDSALQTRWKTVDFVLLFRSPH